MTIKPVIETAFVEKFLQDKFGGPVTDLETLKDGLISQTFGFSVGQTAYIARFNTFGGYDKDYYAYCHFGSTLPIPEIIEVGQIEGLNYALSRRVVGQPMHNLPDEEFEAVVPAVLDTLERLHAIDISGRGGYGYWDGQGQAHEPRWAEHLRGIKDPARSAFWHSRQGFFDNGIIEPVLFEEIYLRMESLLPYCPAERWLVHGDFGFDNLLVAGGQPVAVLDWAEGRYGDFLYDLAWLEYWSPKSQFVQKAVARYQARGQAVPHFEQRLRCYLYYLILADFQFAASTEQPAEYQQAQQRAEELISKFERGV